MPASPSTGFLVDLIAVHTGTGIGRAGALLVSLSGIMLFCHGIVVGCYHKLFRAPEEHDAVSHR